VPELANNIGILGMKAWQTGFFFTVKYGKYIECSCLERHDQLWLRGFDSMGDLIKRCVMTSQWTTSRCDFHVKQNSRSEHAASLAFSFKTLLIFWILHRPESRLAWRRATAYSAIDVGGIRRFVRGS